MKRPTLLLPVLILVANAGVGGAQVVCTDATLAPAERKGVHGGSPKGGSMPTQTNNLYLLEDLDDASKTGPLAKSDLDALRTVKGWINSFVTKPHKDLGRDGPVCPFVP